MPKGTSNRIVVEIPQNLKRKLHAKLSLQGLSLKAWFIKQAEDFTTEPNFTTEPIEPSAGSGGFLSQPPQTK